VPSLMLAPCSTVTTCFEYITFTPIPLDNLLEIDWSVLLTFFFALVSLT